MKVERYISTTLSLFVVLNSFGQMHKQVFEYLAKTQVPEVIEDFRFYYIIDSSKTFKLKEIHFYAFTFSRDSTEKTGYIGYNKKSGDLVFVSDTLNGTKTVVHKLFSLKTNAPTKTGFIFHLGDELTRTVKNDTIIFTTRLTGAIKSHDSHSIYLQKLEFKKRDLYPVSLTFFFPFDDDGIIKLASNNQ